MAKIILEVTDVKPTKIGRRKAVSVRIAKWNGVECRLQRFTLVGLKLRKNKLVGKHTDATIIDGSESALAA